jgi:SAM-dependent methyltransferase
VYKRCVDSSPPEPMTRAHARKAAMTRCLYNRSVVTGEISLPAVPSMLDEYVTMCSRIFADLGRKLNEEDLAVLRATLQSRLLEAFLNSHRSDIVISYYAQAGPTLNYRVLARWFTVAEAYQNWISTREPPLFGTEPDARVWALANEAADPTMHPVLDIGAGTGRNALALARRGHPVDVVEVTPTFADMIRSEAQREALNIRVFLRNIFETTDDLRQDYQLIVLSEVVSDFRTTQQLRCVFELATFCLSPEGRLVFNIFLPRDGYDIDSAARELGQQVYTSVFTRHEVSTAAQGLPLELVADDLVYDYEKTHLPPGAWPPTNWYTDWLGGRDLFPVKRDESPIEMRWLVFRKNH